MTQTSIPSSPAEGHRWVVLHVVGHSGSCSGLVGHGPFCPRLYCKVRASYHSVPSLSLSLLPAPQSPAWIVPQGRTQKSQVDSG